MARTVADCAVLQNAINGAHPTDIASLRENVILPTSYPSVKGLRLEVSYDMGNVLPDVPFDAAIQRLVVKLQGLGAKVIEPHINWPPDISAAARTHAACLSAPFFDQMMQDHLDDLCEYTKWTADFVRSRKFADLTGCIDTAKSLYRNLSPILETCDAVICPTVLTNTVEAEQMPWVTSTIRGVAVNTDYDWVTTSHFNMLGELRALAVPIGLDETGLPVGLQIVARSYDGLRAFGVAAAVEAVVKGDP